MDLWNDEETVIIDESCGEDVFAAEEVHLTRSLTEKDVPGASLNGKDPVVLKVPELKQWLQCRNALMKGKKWNLLPGAASFRCICVCPWLKNALHQHS